MGKICIIKQPAGLGDIFFLQKLVCEIANEGYKIIWPVKNNFLFLTQYIRHPYLTFYAEDEMFPYKDVYETQTSVVATSEYLFLPLQYADRYIAGSMMEAKYVWLNKSFENWVDYFSFKRNEEREDVIFSNILGLQEQDDYILINKHFASLPEYQTITNIKHPTDRKVVEMDFYGLDNLFDWCKVIENASEIYTVETSICYLIEKLNCKASTIHLYSRNREPNFDYIKNIFNKSYKYYEGRSV